MKKELYQELKEGLIRLVEKLNTQFREGNFKLKVKEEKDDCSPRVGGELGNAEFYIQYKKFGIFRSTVTTKINCFLWRSDVIGYRPSSNIGYENVINEYLQEFSQQYGLEISGIKYISIDY